MPKVRALLSLVAVLLFAAVALAGDLPELKYEKFELSNGLDVILHEDHSIPVVSVNLWYHVGSKNEKPGRTGFAHVFEHMMFQGSEHHNTMFDDLLTIAGGTNNGSTTEDRTNYWENVPSNFLEQVLWMEADRMGYLLPAMTQERLDIQRDVIKNERRQGMDNQPYGRVEEYLKTMLFPKDHPYYWSVIGSMEDLSAATLEDVQEFFKMYYAPNNASLCIAGDIDPVQVRAWVEKYFGPIPPGPAIERIEAWMPVLSEEKRMTAEDNVSLARVHMAWHTPAYYAPGDAEFDLLGSILTNGKSSRLYKALVYDKQIAQDVSAYQQSNEIGSAFIIQATAKEGHSLEELEKEIDLILKDVLTTGVTTEEFERARTGWETDFVRSLQRVGGFGGRADVLNKYNTYLGDPGKLLWDRDRYAKATPEGTLKYAQKYLKKDGRAVLYITPHGELTASAEATDMSVVPQQAAEPSFTPPTFEKTTLSNGMQLYVVEDHSLPLVQMNLLINGGWSADPVDRPGTGAVTAALLTEGTKNRTTVQISDEIRRLGLRFNSSSAVDNSSVSVNVLKKNLDPALALMSDIVMNPIFPAEELERQRQNYLGRIQQESKRPFTVAYKTFARELYGADHPYGQPYTGSGTKKSISAIGRADLEAYYKANYIPNNTVAIVVGDITLAEAKSKLEQAFKNWRSGTLPASKVKEVPPLAKTRICIVDKPGAPQSVVVVGDLVMSRNSSGFMAADVAAHVLGAGSTERLYMNLRQDKGYTYGAYSFLTSRKGQGALVAYAQVQTEVTDKAVHEFVKEIRDIGSDRPPTAEEMKTNKEFLVRNFPQDFQTLDNVAGELANIILYGLPENSWLTYIDQVRQVDTDAVVAAAKKSLRANGLLIVIVGDRAKIEQGLRDLNLGEVEILTDDSEA